MAMRSVHGTIVVNLNIHAVIHKVLIIPGKKCRKSINEYDNIIRNCGFFRFRCFVGDGPDQWRTCSERYYPLGSSAGSSSSNQILSTSSNSTNRKKISSISYTTNKRKGANSNSDSYHQQPPRPGGLQNLEDIASARLWPVTYLYSSGPPNSTDLSNFVDCNKESC